MIWLSVNSSDLIHKSYQIFASYGIVTKPINSLFVFNLGNQLKQTIFLHKMLADCWFMDFLGQVNSIKTAKWISVCRLLLLFFFLIFPGQSGLVVVYTAIHFDLVTRAAQNFIPPKCCVSNEGKQRLIRTIKSRLKAKPALAISFLFKD